MTKYSWPQALRILAGREPGDPDAVPDTDLDIQPPAVFGMLAEGVAEVRGKSFHGDAIMRGSIPAAAFEDIQVELHTRPPAATPRRPFGVAFMLPADRLVPKLSAVGGWYDMQIDEAELAELRAELERRATIDKARAEREAAEPAMTAAMRTGAPGRPSSMYLIEAGLAELVAAGTTWPSKGAAAVALREWFKQTHPTFPAPTSRTIENRLRLKIPTAGP